MWLVPHKTAVTSVHVLRIPYNSAPVYRCAHWSHSQMPTGIWAHIYTQLHPHPLPDTITTQMHTPHACTPAHMHAHLHIRMHTRMHACMHACTHTTPHHTPHTLTHTHTHCTLSSTHWHQTWVSIPSYGSLGFGDQALIKFIIMMIIIVIVDVCAGDWWGWWCEQCGISQVGRETEWREVRNVPHNTDNNVKVVEGEQTNTRTKTMQDVQQQALWRWWQKRHVTFSPGFWL